MGESPTLPLTRQFATWSEVAAALDALDPSTLPVDPPTARYAAGMLHAFHTFARVRARTALTYLEQVAAYLELRDIWVPETELDALRSRVLNLLTDAGYPDDLSRGLRAWERARVVPAEQIVPRCVPLVAAALRDTITADIPVPAHVAIDVAVAASPYYAYAHYHGDYRGTVELASDLLWTEETLKHSICHEAFPGRHASASAREWAIEAGT